MINEEEKWLPIFRYENYEVSNLGKVRRTHDHKLIKVTDAYEYGRFKQSQVTLCNPKPKNFSVGRLVADAFIPNIFDQPRIRRLNWDLKNNTVANLEWTGSNGVFTSSEISKRKEALKTQAGDILGK